MLSFVNKVFRLAMTALKVWKNGEPCEVTLMPDRVRIRYLKSRPSKRVTEDIPYRYLLALQSYHDDNNNNSALFIHHARPDTQRRLRVQTISVHADQRTCKLLENTLEQKLTGTERPKRLVVIINPNSGKKQGKKIYHRQVRPLFEMCGVDTRVIVTKSPKETRDLLHTMNLSDVDGVVLVGGDGLYSEVMTGLLTRAQEADGDGVKVSGHAHDPAEVKVDTARPAVSCRLPIGLIPTGTSSMLAQYLHGTRDVTTSALHVLLGRHVTSNVVSVHQGAQQAVLGYSGLVLGCGLQGAIMADCERFRCMGRRRYDVVPFRAVLGRRCHQMEVEYQDVDSGRRHKTSAALYSVDVYVVGKEAEEKEPGADSEGQGQEGKLRHVFGADAMTMYLTGKCGLSKHVQQLSKVKDNTRGAFDYDFVQKCRVESFTVRFPEAATVWRDGQKELKVPFKINCDGEVLRITRPEFCVRLHRHAIRLYGDAIV